MGSDYYADGEGGELEVTLNVYDGNKKVEQKSVTVEVPDDGKVYRDTRMEGDIRAR